MRCHRFGALPVLFRVDVLHAPERNRHYRRIQFEYARTTLPRIRTTPIELSCIMQHVGQILRTNVEVLGKQHLQAAVAGSAKCTVDRAPQTGLRQIRTPSSVHQMQPRLEILASNERCRRIDAAYLVDRTTRGPKPFHRMRNHLGGPGMIVGECRGSREGHLGAEFPRYRRDFLIVRRYHDPIEQTAAQRALDRIGYHRLSRERPYILPGNAFAAAACGNHRQDHSASRSASITLSCCDSRSVGYRGNVRASRRRLRLEDIAPG